MEDFSIDWSNPMAMFVSQQQQMNNGGEEEEEGEVEENDHFYENDNHNLNGQTQPGALEQKTSEVAPPQINAQTDTAATQQKQKLDNQRRAEMLRAKLMAVRQNTPVKVTTPAPNVAKKAPSDTIETPSKAPTITASHSQQQKQQLEQQTRVAPPQPKQEVKPQHTTSELDLEALLNAGKAHADAQSATAQHEDTTRNAPPVSSGTAAPREKQGMDLFPARSQQHQEQQSSTNSTPPPSRPTNLADAYYTDLAAWLDMTGYHDVDYRESKLRTYKERRALEEEAARIAEKLEKLRQAEETEMRLLRVGTPSVKPPAMAPPHLPQTIVHAVSGVKRGRSPGHAPTEKRQREENGFRIRGAKESPEQRAALPDNRRRSIDERGSLEAHSRDPSLERRAQYYRRDGESRPDHYTPRNPAPREPRVTYGHHNGNGVRQGRPNGREMENNYRPSAGMELNRGGVRFFMIKSWCQENVNEALRTNVWATQMKNEETLTDAYRTARYVILLFSVNKSMAFQGYALMTSAPDVMVKKPSFVDRLNWAISDAFRIRWLATTPVDFREVGHVKNTFKLNEETGEPHFVHVGRDGQEISAGAGMQVVWALEDAARRAEPRGA